MKTLAKLFRWLRGDSNAPQMASPANTYPAIHLPAGISTRAVRPRGRPHSSSALSVVEKLDALPLTLLTTLSQAEIAELAGVSGSGVSVYRRTRGIVGAKSRRKK